jgi:hypothetical protein
MKKKRPDIDKTQMVNNPLTQTNFRILVDRRTAENSFKVHKDGTKLPLEIEMERERYVKLFNNPDARKSFGLLTGKARSLLMFIMFELDPGQDYLWINKDRYKKEYLVHDDRTYGAAILELVRYLFIQPSVYPDTYWINPRLFFCGSRINKYPNAVKCSNDEE